MYLELEARNLGEPKVNQVFGVLCDHLDIALMLTKVYPPFLVKMIVKKMVQYQGNLKTATAV